MNYKLLLLTVVTVRTPGIAPVVTAFNEVIPFDSEVEAHQAAYEMSKEAKSLLAVGINRQVTKLFVTTPMARQAMAMLNAPIQPAAPITVAPAIVPAKPAAKPAVS